MKKLMVLILSVFLYADVSEIITLIKGMENYNPKFKHISGYNPFVKIKKKAETKEKRVKHDISEIKEKNLVLYAIFQNRVNINGKWFKVGDVVNGYKIIKINTYGIYLSKNNKIKKISLKANIIKVAK